MLGALAIAATYVGTVVGAGFASGQEIMQFFTLFGPDSIKGLLLAMTLFGLFGWITLRLGHTLGTASYRSAVIFSGGQKTGNLLDALITIFLFGSLVTMTAGAGALAYEEWGIPEYVGRLGLIVITLITVAFGLRGLVSSMSVISPILVLSVLFIAVAAWQAATLGGHLPLEITYPVTLNALQGKHWAISALLYVGYNMLGAMPVLLALGHGSSRKPLAIGAIVGALALGLSAVGTDLSLKLTGPEIVNYQIPLAKVAATVSPKLGQLFGLILLAEIYTTSTASLFAFASRASGSPRSFLPVTMVSALLALMASKTGFMALVVNLYHAMGVAGILLLIVLVRGAILTRKD